jgi:hypothetical protein
MARVDLGNLGSFDIPSTSELKQIISQAQAIAYERLRGRDTVRFQSPYAAAVSNAITLPAAGTEPAYPLGPSQGFVWSVRFLVVNGLTASATAPDIVDIYKHGTAKRIWQLNGNQFAQTFGRGEIILYPGESLYIVNNGSIAATGNIEFHGQADQVPFDRKGDLL